MKLKKIVAALLLIVAPAALGDVSQLGPNLFVAGVPTAPFEFFAARQRQANWCWAAAIQMVLNYHGLFVSQEDVVRRVFGAEVDLPGSPQQILAALSGWAPDVSGRFSAIYASPYTASGSQIVQDLGYRWPLIAGLSTGGGGHAVVVTAVTYSVDRWNNPIFHSVVIRDPWPGSPSRQELPWSEFEQRLTFLAHVHVKHL